MNIWSTIGLLSRISQCDIIMEWLRPSLYRESIVVLLLSQISAIHFFVALTEVTSALVSYDKTHAMTQLHKTYNEGDCTSIHHSASFCSHFIGIWIEFDYVSTVICNGNKVTFYQGGVYKGSDVRARFGKVKKSGPLGAKYGRCNKGETRQDQWNERWSNIHIGGFWYVF